MPDGYCKMCKLKGKEIKLIYVTKKTPMWVSPIWPPTEEFECPECGIIEVVKGISND